MYCKKIRFITKYFNVLPIPSVSVSSDEVQTDTLNRSAPSLIPTGSSNLSSSLSPLEEDGDPLLQSRAAPAEAASSTRQQAVFSSVLTVRANADSLVQYPASPHANAYNLTNRKIQEDPPAKAPHAPTKSALSSSSGTAPAAWTGGLNSAVFIQLVLLTRCSPLCFCPRRDYHHV